MSTSTPAQDRGQYLSRFQWSPRWTALLLSIVGGMVDAVGYLNLGHLFIGFMSGNSIKLGIGLGHGQWHEALRFAIPIAVFLVGVMSGALLFEFAARRRVRSPVALLLGLEALLLAGYVLCGDLLLPGGKLGPAREISFGFVLSVILLAVAMGMQTAALQHIGSHSVHTTFVTGMLTTLARQSATILLYTVNKRTGRKEYLNQNPSRTWPLLLAGVWCVYVAGAAAGAYGLRHFSVNVLLFPLLILLFIIMMALRREPGISKEAGFRQGQQP